MECVMCGGRPQGDNLYWRGLKVNDQPFFVCPKEFPPNDASVEAFQQAYLRIIQKISAVLMFHQRRN